MNVISESTAAEDGLTAPDKLPWPLPEPGSKVTRLTPPACRRAIVVRSNAPQRTSSPLSRLAAHTATSETFEMPQGTANRFKTYPKAPLSQPPLSATCSLYFSARAVSRLSSGEQIIHAILAISAVFAAVGGLYWVAQLVSHWPLFSAGIGKLMQ